MARSKDIHLVVVTPEQQVVDEPADSVVLPAHDGELGVLHGRAPLMCELGIGQLRYTRAGRTRRLFVDGGFAQVRANEVTVLTPSACREEAITEQMVADAEQAPRDRAGRARRRASVLRGLCPKS